MRSPLRYRISICPGILVHVVLYCIVNQNLLHSSYKHDKGFTLFIVAAQDRPSPSGDGYNVNISRSNASLSDLIEDSFFDPIKPDPSCSINNSYSSIECSSPPISTIEEDILTTVIDATALYGGEDPSTYMNDEGESIDENILEQQLNKVTTRIPVDKHWGKDQTILRMRDKLRYGHLPKRSIQQDTSKFPIEVEADSENTNLQNTCDDDKLSNNNDPHSNKRPPVFLLPGLASTRLVSWKTKICSNPLLSPIKALEYVWMNINLLIQATIDSSCFAECMTLGKDQADTDDENIGCKLRADEGLDAISSLAPGSLGSNLLVGGTNTVYAWLIQWLAENLGMSSRTCWYFEMNSCIWIQTLQFSAIGYDSSSIVGLPYDWRLSPDVMEKRDGFLTLMRKRIEAAVESNGNPGIMVAHSVTDLLMKFPLLSILYA